VDQINKANIRWICQKIIWCVLWLDSFVCRHGDTWLLSSCYGCLRGCVEHVTWRSCLLVFLPFRSLNHVFMYFSRKWGTY